MQALGRARSGGVQAPGRCRRGRDISRLPTRPWPDERCAALCAAAEIVHTLPSLAMNMTARATFRVRTMSNLLVLEGPLPPEAAMVKALEQSAAKIPARALLVPASSRCGRERAPNFAPTARVPSPWRRREKRAFEHEKVAPLRDTKCCTSRPYSMAKPAAYGDFRGAQSAAQRVIGHVALKTRMSRPRTASARAEPPPLPPSTTKKCISWVALACTTRATLGGRRHADALEAFDLCHPA